MPETRELKRQKTALSIDLGVQYSQRRGNVIDLWVLEMFKGVTLHMLQGPWWLPARALPGW